MKFHTVHGSAITLSEFRCCATRSDSHFCNGIVFSDQAIKTGQKVCIELTCSQNWSGALRIGFTSNDPGRLSAQDLPKYAVPNLTKRDGYWVRPVSESLTADGVRLMFYVTPVGHVHSFINNEHKGALFANLPTDKSLWVMFDLYGNTRSIKFVKPDDAPKEILARGPEAIQAYDLACTSGMRPVYRSRLMLVGQDGVGKTSLRHALLGQQHSPSEAPTSGIDLSSSCSFHVGNHGNWVTVGSGQDSEDAGDSHGKPDIIGPGDTGVDELEEEYHQAVASNIVQELLYQKRRRLSQLPKSRGTASKLPQRNSADNGARKFKPSSASLSTKFNEIPSEMLHEVPDRVVELVQKLLDQGPEVKNVNRSMSEDSVSMVTRPPDGSKVVLNVWDFAGKETFYSTHQVFLTSRAVYVIVFNLCDNFLESQSETELDELSPLDYIDFWMRSVYCHASSNRRTSFDNTMFSPPVVLVGTHSRCLNVDPGLCSKAIEEKFAQIQEFLIGKPYIQHLTTPFFAVDTSEHDIKIGELKCKIEEVLCLEPYMGERMPIRWIRFEQTLNTLVAGGTNHASYDQIAELASNLGVVSGNEVRTMLEFYHDLGKVIFYGSGKGHTDNLLRNTVILKPSWLIDMVKSVTAGIAQPADKWPLVADKWVRLEESGILEEQLLDCLWHDAQDQKLVLVGLLEKMDLICQRLPSLSESQSVDSLRNRSFYVPSRLQRYKGTKALYVAGQNDVTFYIDFHGFLPAGLFHRILVRTVRWSQELGRQNPYYLYQQLARFYLDDEHDLVLEMSHKTYSRVKVVVLRVSEPEDDSGKGGEGDGEPDLPAHSPEAIARVRNFLESCLLDLRELWMRRITYTVCIACPCVRICETHKIEGCTNNACLHFLNMDECLSNKVVCCEHRRVKTAFIRKCFPEPLSLGFSGPVLPPISLVTAAGNIEKHCPTLPTWVKSAAKLLNSGETDRDWNALAIELGYKQNQINKFDSDLNPGLALLADWIVSTGNTGLSVDMLTVYLEKLDREDIVDVIQKANEHEQDAAQVFLSYQWDCQAEAKSLRDKLERSGFTCWMDIGQLGGGDQLYTKIDEAMRHSKVVIACISPKYVVSQHCIKELSLADLLRKPILPVMVEKVPWPPPGGMSLILSQLIYINMKGIGGHGGTGIHADKNDKYKEILQRVGLYAVPTISRSSNTQSETDKHQYIELETEVVTGMNYSTETLETYSSPSPIMTPRNYESDREHVQSWDHPPPVEMVHVTRCRICVIL